jgi:uncharacterized protein (UPF0333 family)
MRMLFTNNSYQENNNNTINTNNNNTINTNNNNTINTDNTITTNNTTKKISIFPKNMFIMASPSDKCVSCGH